MDKNDKSVKNSFSKSIRQRGMNKASIPAGIFPCCKDPKTGQAYLLLGQEGNGKWSFFQGNNDKTDKTIFHTAAREASEELCCCLGTTEEILNNYLLNEEIRLLEIWGGGYLTYLGELDEAERLKIIVKFYENRYLDGLHIGRKLTSCEKEMIRIVWVKADIFYQACVLSEKGKKSISVPEFKTGVLRNWITEFFGSICCNENENKEFKDFCLNGVLFK